MEGGEKEREGATRRDMMLMIFCLCAPFSQPQVVFALEKASLSLIAMRDGVNGKNIKMMGGAACHWGTCDGDCVRENGMLRTE